MNKLKLKARDADRIVYEYLPEGRGTPGEVTYIFTDREATVSKRASEDTANNYYGEKAVFRLEDYVAMGDYPDTATQAWY